MIENRPGCPIHGGDVCHHLRRGRAIKELGDFSPGRYGCVLNDVRPLPEPVPARGALGLWDWQP